jgi:hypothetical protein
MLAFYWSPKALLAAKTEMNAVATAADYGRTAGGRRRTLGCGGDTRDVRCKSLVVLFPDGKPPRTAWWAPMRPKP